MKYWILNSFMSDLFDSLARRFESFSDGFSKNGKKYFQSVLSKGEKILAKALVIIYPDAI